MGIVAEEDYLRTTYSSILSFEDLMQYLAVSERTVYRLIDDGTFPAWKDEEGKWCFLRSDIIEFIERASDF